MTEPRETKVQTVEGGISMRVGIIGVAFARILATGALVWGTSGASLACLGGRAGTQGAPGYGARSCTSLGPGLGGWARRRRDKVERGSGRRAARRRADEPAWGGG